jgi:hypothetical protein
MTGLIDEIRTAFEKSKTDVIGEDGNSFAIVSREEDLVPGFAPARSSYETKLMVLTRRGYRHFAGSDLPTDADALLVKTGEFMTAQYVAAEINAFSDGVMIGHQHDQMVKMMTHFNNLGHLFHDDGFREASLQMAHGFASDQEITYHFTGYLTEAVTNMAHVTGFAHSQVVPAKVWDIWLMAGAACVTASFLAGSKLGTTWKERDVLDGIEIASGSEAEDGDGH